MSRPQLLLGNQLCFLFHRISRELTAAYRPLLADLGLTYPQYLVMLALWESDGIGVGELGDRLDLDTGTLSPLLRRMEQAGLLSRVRSRADERRVTVQLTEAGRALEARAAEVPGALASHLVDDAASYSQLKAQLEELAARLAERGAQPAAGRSAGGRGKGDPR